MIFIIFWAIVFYWYIWYLFFGDYKYLNILTTALQIIYTLELDFHFLIILGRLNDSCSPPPPSPTPSSPTPSSPYPPPSSTPPSPSPSTITFFLSFFATLTFSFSFPHMLYSTVWVFPISLSPSSTTAFALPFLTTSGV